MPEVETDRTPAEEIVEKIGPLSERLEAIEARLPDAPSDEQKAMIEELPALRKQLDDLNTEKEVREAEAEREASMKAITELKREVEELRKPSESGFEFAGGVPVSDGAKAIYGEGTGHSYFADVRSAQRGDQIARQRIEQANEAHSEDVKAMTEGTDSAGGFLVEPQLLPELTRLRYNATPLRSRFSQINVTTDSVKVTQQTGGLTAGWVDELATKPAADMTFAQVTASVFTVAGMAVVSNQLLADSRPSIDSLIVPDIATKIATVEEIAFINGSGTAQPRGILNTSGTTSVVVTDATPTAAENIDAILGAIVTHQDTYKGDLDTIVMHPRAWAKIIQAKDTAGRYLAEASWEGRTIQSGVPSKTLFGYPVVTTYNAPTNLGAGTNEGRIILGDFSRGLILDRQGITVDDSSHVYFTTNQTVFRVESRVGFTAAREPAAFTVLSGTGLVGF
jgi:HK97 family phage major capsid protein